jgi:hypothetical protein
MQSYICAKHIDWNSAARTYVHIKLDISNCYIIPENGREENAMLI